MHPAVSELQFIFISKLSSVPSLVLVGSAVFATILLCLLRQYPDDDDLNCTDNSSQAYQRLESGHVPKSTTSGQSASVAATSKASWFFRKPKATAVMPMPKPRIKKQPAEETEREWLLLGEPHSPRNTVMLDDSHAIVDTSILTVAEPLPGGSDDILEEEELTDSDSSTDIDAIVDEYRQKFKVNTTRMWVEGAHHTRPTKVSMFDAMELIIIIYAPMHTFVAGHHGRTQRENNASAVERVVARRYHLHGMHIDWCRLGRCWPIDQFENCSFQRQHR